jgi:catechol 2,3-dioxygenase-like lactoylglutathione lyase family enzyme
MKDFKIQFLDHVAIRVRDLEASAAWYEKVFGFTKNQFKEWGEFPIFMLAGKAGIALFPADVNDAEQDAASKNVKIDHFAFHVDHINFELAKEKLVELNIDYSQQNHHFFESIYINDPDGHCVELTTILVQESDFYKPY